MAKLFFVLQLSLYEGLFVCLLFSLDRKQGFYLKCEGKLCSVQSFYIPYGVGLGWGTVPSLHIKQKSLLFPTMLQRKSL